MKKSNHRCLAYLRVSTNSQDTEKNKSDILKFCNDRDFGRVEFIEEIVSGRKPWRERKTKDLIESLQSGDRLILPEISRLGRSCLEIVEMLSILKDKDVAVYAIKGNWELNGSIQSKVMALVFSLVAEIERELIVARTKEGLRIAREKGRLLGRPKGPGKSKLDRFKPEIEALIKNGSKLTFIAQRYNSSVPNLATWIKTRQINVKAQP